MRPRRSHYSKSPRAVALEALAVARERLPAYAHRFSHRRFTQHQLFALLVLKAHQRQDYRGLVALLADMPQLVADLGLAAVPHFTTLQKAAARLLADGGAQRLLDGTVERHRKKPAARSTSRPPTRPGSTRRGPAGTTSAAARPRARPPSSSPTARSRSSSSSPTRPRT